MQRRFFRRFSATVAAAAAVATLGFAAASPAGAATAGHYTPFSVSGTTNDTNGEAGYYVNDSGGWRIRDSHASFTVIPAMKDLNGTTNGAVGNELCNPNNGNAAQLGVVWTGTAYQVRFNTGSLFTSGTDPCVEGGLLSSGFGTLLDSITIHTGDVLEFDVYYNPETYWLKFTATDVTQDVTRQASQYVGYQSFYEAGIGVLSSNVPALTPPAVDPVAEFFGANFTSYSAASGSHSILGGWDTRQAQTVNGGDQVILTPASSLNGQGNAFNVYEGGII